MSLSLLLEKYDVSTDEGLAKALGEIEKEETEVDEALSNAMSRACALESQLHAASQAYTKLAEVKNDAQAASDMVDKTAALAKDVSAKVRQLDLARSRVAECQRRVHDLIDLQLCSAGVEAAINANDYETGAAHVARFLGMAPGSLAAARARGAADPRAAMDRAAATLRDLLRARFEEAARKDDTEAVERLFKLFPQIGRAEEGVDLFAKYLAAQVEAESRQLTGGGAGGAAGAYSAALGRLLEGAARAAGRARHLAAPAAPGHLPRTLATLQPVVCASAGRVYREMARARGLAEAAGEGTVRAAGEAGQAPRDALSAEPALVELAAAHRTVLLYLHFLRRNTQADAAPLDDKAKEACMEATEKIIAECDLTRTAQDILGHYLKLERYFLEENVNKALKMAAPQPGVTTSSLVDDLFFIARKAISRAVRTGSVEGVCAVLNEAGGCVERGAAWLGRALRSPRGAPPPLLPPPPTFAAAALGADAPPTAEALAQRDLFLAHMSEAAAGAAWAERLAGEAGALAAPLAAGDARGQRKLAHVAAGLAAAAAPHRAALHAGRAALHALHAPRLAAWARYAAAPAPPKEMEEDADALPQALEALAEQLRAALPASLADSILLQLVTDLADRIDDQLLLHHYDREGGLGVERRARRLAAWAGGAAGGARERLARLAGAAAVLALERPQHAADGRAPPPPRLRDLLARRTDFKIEEIKRLKL